MTGADVQFDEIDGVLLDGYQSGFPIVERPFETIARDTSYTAGELLDRLRAHTESGLVRRIGPVLDPSVIGASTLAALRVDENTFEAVADVVSEYPEVSHNYRRDNEWNLWFVVTASSSQRLESLLGEIETRTGYEPLNLPKQRQYCLDLQFPIVGERRDRGRSRTAPTRSQTDRQLTAQEREVLEGIQDGFTITETPYRRIADELDVEVSVVLSTIRGLYDDGFVKRVGIVVNHHAAGFTSNCMIAWAVPPEEIDRVGERASERPYVTKCYRRARRPDRGWNYSLFTMLHGRDGTSVGDWVDELADDIVPYRHVKLETVERLKQTGTRYSDLLDH